MVKVIKTKVGKGGRFPAEIILNENGAFLKSPELKEALKKAGKLYKWAEEFEELPIEGASGFRKNSLYPPNISLTGTEVKVVVPREVAEEVFHHIVGVIQKKAKEIKRLWGEEFLKAIRGKGSSLKVRYWFGCDTGLLYAVVEFPENGGYLQRSVDSELFSFKEKRVEPLLKKAIDKAIERLVEEGKTPAAVHLADEWDEEREVGVIRLSKIGKELKEVWEEKKKKAKERGLKALERQERVKKALEEAKRTGKEVVLWRTGVFDGDDYETVRLLFPELLKDFGELGVIETYLVATPEGKLKEIAVPSY